MKYNYIPLAKTIETVLDIVKEALGAPVEIEFAIDLKKDKDYKASFYLLQIKPLFGSAQDYEINMDEIDRKKILLLSEKGMGNGILEQIQDVVYVDIDVFDKSMTVEMANEIEEMNRTFVEQNRNYILIGPGRWGTRDRWIGIPVNWPQISKAKVIVETSLEGYPLDASSGSHFFHNVTSMNVGYYSVQSEISKGFINWEVLKKQKIVRQSKFIKHVCFEQPLSVKMDGKKRMGIVSYQED